MKRILILSFLSVVVLSSCWNVFGKRIHGDGAIKTENRDITGYNSIDASGDFDVYVKQDSVSSVKIETDENLLRYIIIRTEGNILKIYPRSNYNLRPSGSIKVYVSGPEFKHFEASGACDYYTENKISSTDNISIDLSGSCDAKMELNAPKISAEISGSGSVTLKGETKELSVDGSGSSDFKCFDLMAENVSIVITGSGDADVFASVKLNVDVSGSGSVQYKGNATVNQRVRGSGSVKKVD
ncbi:MAG: DUF2807 domain-containing protein [Bacteroidetes bacterium]|nr:DUF2807 domain-containing protein [Bacteroidota bacterium]MBS1931489.1 DUF2807 domain-containing protein [Bacteroidota bacterium]